jgi:hypothetical protein
MTDSSRLTRTRIGTVGNSDDGVGLAARASQMDEIYWGRIENEQDSLTKTFQAGFSIKAMSDDAAVQ